MADAHGLDRIRDAVMAQADREVTEIRTRTEREIERIGRDSARRIERILDEARAEAETERTAGDLRTQSMARLDERRVLLTARQNLIQEAVDQALQEMIAADDTTKIAWYTRLLPRDPAAGTTAEAARGERDLLTRAIRDAGLDDRITVAETEGTFDGGFRLRNGRVTDNLTFAQLFTLRADALRQAAAEVLFRRAPEADTAPDPAAEDPA